MASGPITGIHTAWGVYQQCSATSAFYKRQLETFTKLSLWLGIAGAVIATVAPFVNPSPTAVVSKVLAIAGAAAVTLAGIAAKQAMSGSKDKLWIRCRAAGEALKSSVYLYGASVAPFDDANKGTALAQRVEQVLKNLQGIVLWPGESKSQAPGILSVGDYITARVDDQIDFYTKRASGYQKKADFWRYCAVAGAAVSAALGAISAVFSLSPWIALLATLTASITAYVKNQRYEGMITLYQATAIRLRLLKDQWLDSAKTEADKQERDSFIQRCEETMSLENGAWVAQWSETAANR